MNRRSFFRGLIGAALLGVAQPLGKANLINLSDEQVRFEAFMQQLNETTERIWGITRAGPNYVLSQWPADICNILISETEMSPND